MYYNRDGREQVTQDWHTCSADGHVIIIKTPSPDDRLNRNVTQTIERVSYTVHHIHGKSIARKMKRYTTDDRPQ